MHILYDTMYFRQVTFISAGYFTYSFLWLKALLLLYFPHSGNKTTLTVLKVNNVTMVI